jgi:LysM repeat protein
MTAAIVGIVFVFASSSHTAYAEQVPSHKNVNTVSRPQKMITVQSGDDLSNLASSNSTTVQRLYDANSQISDPDLIYPEEQLRIPSPNEQLATRPMPGAPAPTVLRQNVSPTTQFAIGTSDNGSVWDRLAQCESGGNWGINTGNGFYGGLQFTLRSWESVGGSGYPNLASQAEQIALAQKLQAIQGWRAWPTCSSRLGL